MRLIFLLALLPLASCDDTPQSLVNADDLDPYESVNEDEFEALFDLTPADDPEEEARRAEALKENEEKIKEENELYSEGKRPWFDAVNDFANLPQEEFEAEKTGEVDPPGLARGLLEPTGSDRVDFASEQYFANFRARMKTNRATTPDSYDSVAEGYVTDVKNQKECGSCVAFSNMAAIETCFRKVTGTPGDYSEQQLVDCGYEKNGASGCNGAYSYSYIKTIADDQLDLTAEATYPYKNTNPSLTCPALKSYNQGAKVTGVSFTYDGDEETMKSLVAEHGAVVTSVRAGGEMQNYKGGVFTGCTSDQTDHAVTVVGYGTDAASGLDYWKIKNSWGNSWGESGFIRLQRGVGMCGVGKAMVVAKCAKVDGPTDAPITTETPCVDKWTNCAEMAEEKCYQTEIGEECPKSCGKCPGDVPVASNTCYNLYTNCDDLCKTYPDHAEVNEWCRKACGKC